MFCKTIFMLLLGLAITLILIAVALLCTALEQRRQWRLIVERRALLDMGTSPFVKSVDTIFKDFERRVTIKFGCLWAALIALALIAMRYML